LAPLLSLVLLTAPTLGCGSGHRHRSRPVATRPARPCPTPDFRVVDLSHAMHEGMPYWPGGVPFKMTRLVDYDQGYRAHTFEVGENTGTHVDAPAHFVQGGRTIDQLSAAELVMPLVVIDVSQKTKGDPDYALSANDVVDWEAANGNVPPGSLVVANTGWHALFSSAPQYVNQDDAGVMHFPGFAADAAQLLIERDVAGIATDTLSIDPGRSKDFAVHKLMLGADKLMLENLANLGDLPESGATVVIGVLRVTGGTQAQARVLALIPDVPGDSDDDAAAR
jgi:kynurenine formamidase